MTRLTHLDTQLHYNIFSYADSHANIPEIVHKKLTLVNENLIILSRETGLKQNKLGSQFLQG